MNNVPERPCRICGKATPAYRRKDGRGFTYRRQCDSCKHKPRDPDAWHKNMSASKIGERNPKHVPVGTKCKSEHGNGFLYVKIKTSDGRWQFEHRVNAAKSLGRTLGRYEQVHHINGDTTDNRPENLKVVSFQEHKAIHFPASKIRLTCDCCGVSFERYRKSIKSIFHFCSKKCFDRYSLGKPKTHRR